MTHPIIAPFGEAAIICTFPPPATLAVQTRLWAIAHAARRWPHVTEAVPGMNNLTLLFDPLAGDADALTERLTQAFDDEREVREVRGAMITIPVCYGGENGPDLEHVAQHTGLAEREVIERHGAAEYVVFFIGFMPGFAYLGGLDPQLATPRLELPRLHVPAGSVGIGGEQTGIYPLESPGGWQLIGRTHHRLFDPTGAQPSLLKPGDRVRFVIEGQP